ncbi:MAG: LCP family protein [Clostridia bacterium]|nr:LCP family protein [Clostridia bacterium]
MKHGLDDQGRFRSRGLIVSLLVYAVLGCLLIGVGKWLDLIDQNDPEEQYGDLSQRFVPTVMMELAGEERAYYHNYHSNVLIIGVDRESFAASTSMRSGGQADFLMLLSIARDTRSITPIHIDRDTVTDVQVYGAFGNPAGVVPMQVCLSHAFGRDEASNSENTVLAVSNLLAGIPIDHYIAMDMSGIAALNDALGGVTVTLEEDFSMLDPAMTKGATVTLQGKQAEYYVRGRYGVGDYTNRQRMVHQRQFVTQAAELITEKLRKEPEFLIQLFDDLDPHLATTVDDEWLLSQSYAMQHYQINEIHTLQGEHRVGGSGFMEFHPEQKAMEEMLLDVFFE